MAWIMLIFGGLCEVGWATAMKLSNGFSHLGWSVTTIVIMILSFAGLITASKSLPLGIAYPVWTGIGAVGSVIVSAVVFHDQMNLWTWLFVVLLVGSIIGLKVSSGN